MIEEPKEQLTNQDIALYMGCEAIILNPDTGNQVRETIGGMLLLYLTRNPLMVCKPFLRPLSDMTDEEKKVYYRIKNGGGRDQRMMDAEATTYLIRRRVDALGWIEKRLAIDKTKEEDNS